MIAGEEIPVSLRYYDGLHSFGEQREELEYFHRPNPMTLESIVKGALGQVEPWQSYNTPEEPMKGLNPKLCKWRLWSI